MNAAPESKSHTRKGFFASLFDFSFEEFITTSLIKVIYAILVVLAGLGALVTFLGFASQGGAGFVLGLIVVPIAFFAYVILARVWLEFLVVVFRIADHTAGIERNTRR